MAQHYIYTTKHVSTPKEYVRALEAGYVVIKIPREKHKA